MWKKKSKGDRAFDITLVVISILIILVIAYPLYFVVIASFSQPEAVLGGKLRFLPVGFNLESYQMVLTEPKVWTGYRNTILYTVLGTCINLVLTTLAAYPLSRKDMPFRGILTFVASFTMLFGGGMIPVYLVVRGLKLTDSIWAMVIPNALATYNMLVMKNYFQSSIPEELQEAAAIDGAGRWKVFAQITIPLLRPIMLYVFVTSLIGGLQLFDLPFLMNGVAPNTAGEPSGCLQTAVMYLYKFGFETHQVGYASAIAYTLFFIILIVSIIQFKTLGREED